ncbi:protease modulator HflC [uncultured Methylovirgula sp.]|uniref:protease modulator HflC n=1 Tax=uncultured Methylovirgula sp. TaxID=1285960 RepID=UPI002606EEBC|nr:protease modulator HflC [uncultured Methylovirgula sp.]
MKGASGFFLVLLAIVAVVVAAASVFTVGQTEQALVLRFGDPVAGRGLVTEPGLHFKIPFIETVVLLDKRILDVETPTQEVLASDSTRVEVDSFLKYRIVDPLKFYQSVGNTDRAGEQLGYILNSAVRRVLGDADLSQIVSGEREALMGAIRQQVNQQTAKLGVVAVDVRIRRTDLPQQISEKVFSRMQSEWARQAALYRAQGSEQSQEIKAKADRDVVVLRADAQRDADKIRGAGDAERARIFAAAFSKDPDFFAFYRSMQAYVAGLKSSNTRYVLSPKSAFFRFFSPAEAAPLAAAPAH